MSLEQNIEALSKSTTEFISETAKREAKKTEHDIYTEVFMDEINA